RRLRQAQAGRGRDEERPEPPAARRVGRDAGVGRAPGGAPGAGGEAAGEHEGSRHEGRRDPRGLTAMVRKLIEWALNNVLVVLLLTAALVGFGAYAFMNVNVEAYPDPAPAIIEVIAQYPGYSAEEVERLVTIPLEIGLAGLPGLQYTRSKSLAGLSHLRNQFEYGIDYYAARQEAINRLAMLQGLPAGVNPQISPFTPTGELVRYSLSGPKRPLRPDVSPAPDNPF